ncbi:MAG: primosomal protein N', partial [Acidobacteria bacterium]|nr:primosomal protein N' [Acidobacteriota bacterium]
MAVPLHVSQSFVYRLPEWMHGTARVGARVLVPLGRNLTTGYIVHLHNTLQADTNLSEAGVKEVEQVLDADPLVTPEVLQITQWVSEYYGA